MTIEGWNNPTAVGLQLLLAGDPHLLVCMNEDAHEAVFVLPAGNWTLEISTDPDVTSPGSGRKVSLVGRSLVVFSG